MRLAVVCVFVLSLVTGAAAPTQFRASRAGDILTIDSLTGEDTFKAYCAPCHGRTGAGDGPVASVLRTPPADLRTLTSRHGSFPRDELTAFVTGTGRPVAAHGTSDMPIWGVIFRSLDPDDARVKVRLQNVVNYIESLQR